MTSEIAAAIDEIRELSGDVADVLSGGNPHDTLTYRGTLLHRLLEAACVLQRHVLHNDIQAKYDQLRDEVESLGRYVACEGYDDELGNRVIGLAYDGGTWGPTADPKYEAMEALESVEKWLKERTAKMLGVTITEGAR